MSGKQLKVSFISNCGFLVQAGEKKILFDMEGPDSAFERTGVQYAHDLLAANKPPFDGLTTILISHAHPDHIGIQNMAEYLFKNPNINIFSTVDTVADLVKADATSGIAAQAIVIDPYETRIIEKTIAGIKVKFLGLYHAGAPAYVFKDLSFVIELDEIRIFYLSDIDPGYDKNLEVIQDWAAENDPIDLLFTPDINLYASEWAPKGFEVIRKYIKPARVIAMHIDPRKVDEAEKKVRVNFPDTVIFRTCLEQKTFDF